MGNDTIINREGGAVIDQDFFNIFNRVLQGDFLGRDSSGAVTAGQNLGSLTIPWGVARINTLVLGGSTLDSSSIISQQNKIISGPTRSTSDFPDFIRAGGGVVPARYTVTGSVTSIEFDVNGEVSSITSDIVKSGLATAATTGNTCLLNDSNYTAQDSSKNAGEDGGFLIVDNMGASVTSKIGSQAAFRNNSTGELFLCRVASSIRLDQVRRGFFIDSNGSPNNRQVLSNNDIFQIMSLGYVFADVDGVTVDTSYLTPVVSGNAPTAPVTGQYWLDGSVNAWKRFNGSVFEIIDRIFIGYIAVDTINCIGSRSEYFRKNYNSTNTCEVDLKNITTMISNSNSFTVSINGKLFESNFKSLEWTVTDFESGVPYTSNRDYYLYVTENGVPQLSDKKPYDLRGQLKGFYHPFESWRCVASVYNASPNAFQMIDRSYFDCDELPIGSVIQLAYDDGTAPKNYIRTNGASLDTVLYSALFRRLQYTWGGSGSNFNLPDDRGVVLRGLDEGSGRDSGRVFGQFQNDAMQRMLGNYNVRSLSGVTTGPMSDNNEQVGDGVFKAGQVTNNSPAVSSAPGRQLNFDNAGGGLIYFPYKTSGTGTGDGETRVKNNTRIFAIKYQ